MTDAPLMHTYDVRYTRTVAVFRYTELGVIPKGLNEYVESIESGNRVYIRERDVWTNRKLKAPILWYFKDGDWDEEIKLGDWILVDADPYEPLDVWPDKQFRKQYPDIVKKAEAEGLT